MQQHNSPVLLGVPWDAASSFMRGPARAPAAIRAALASPHSNSWTETGGDVAALADAGDVSLANDRARGAEARAAIEDRVDGLLAEGARPIVLGGDHSITYPVLRAVRRHAPRLTIVHFDAHPDLYDALDGDRWSHATPFARAMEEGLADRLVQVGIRAATGHQREQARRFGIETVDMRAWHAGARPAVDGPLYVSVDLDVLDPAFAPGVSHHEPGGLSTRELLAALAALPRTIVACDVVELNPDRDPSGVTAVVAAKVVKELAGAMMATSTSA
jgi:arginase